MNRTDRTIASRYQEQKVLDCKKTEARGHNGSFRLASVALVAAALFSTPSSYASALDAESLTDTRTSTVKKVDWDGVIPTKLQARLAASAAQVSGRALTYAQARTLAADLTQQIREAGYPLGLVLLTPQNWNRFLDDGVLRLKVFRGDVGNIAIGKNTSAVSDARILKTTRNALCGGEELPCALTSDRLERVSLLLGDMPGVGVDPLTLSPEGVAVGQTAVAINTFERERRITGGVSLDNYGVSSTGANRLGGAIQVANLFRQGDVFSLGGQTTNRHQNTGVVSMSIPVLYNGLRFEASAARTSYSVANVNAWGTVTSVQAGVSYPLMRAFNGNWVVSLDGYDAVSKQGINDQGAFAPRHLKGLHAGISGNSGDRALYLGESYWAAAATLTAGKLTQSIGGVDTSSTLGGYQKLSASYTHKHVFGHDWFVLTNISGQVSSSNLDGSEALTVGGINSMRAYASSEGTVDEGLQINVELRKAFSLPNGVKLVPGVFVDYLNGWILHSTYANWQTSLGYSNPNQSNHRSLNDWGFGVDMVTDKGVTAGLNVAWKTPWSERPLSGRGSADARVLFTLGMRF